MFAQCKEIKRWMNEAGRRSTPFLCGVDFEMSQGFFIPYPLEQQEVLFELRGITNSPPLSVSTPFHFEAFPEDFSSYQQRFERVREGLLRGDTFLLNLTSRTAVESSLSLLEIFQRSRSPYRLYLPDRFVSFSPECFITIEEDAIYTYPMKGTIDASIAHAAEVITNDYKEKAEHYTIVDLLRNDLNRVATEVEVLRFRYIDHVPTHRGAILQVSSEVRGALPSNWREILGDLLFELLPAGSVSGAPKASTLRIIRASESAPRGYYTGVFGYFDGERFNSAVLIRYIEEAAEGLFFRSGGGITINSRSEEEYREMIEKIYLPFT